MRCWLALVVLALVGCALFPLSEADCKPSSWRAKGYDDGFHGMYAQDARYISECARFGVQVAQSEYLAGWRDGHDEWDRLMGSVDMD